MTEREKERAAVVAWIRREARKLRDDLEQGYWDGDEACGERIAEMYDDTAWVVENGRHLQPRKD